MGAEIRYLTALRALSLNRKTGEGLFLGPTLFWKIADNMAFNAVWTPQIAGKARDVSGPLDLDNFERHQFRVSFR